MTYKVTGPVGSMTFDSQFGDVLSKARYGEYVSFEDRGTIVKMQVVHKIEAETISPWVKMCNYFSDRAKSNIWIIRQGEYGEVYVGGHNWHYAVFAAYKKGWWKPGQLLYRFMYSAESGQFYQIREFELEVLIKGHLENMLHKLYDELDSSFGTEACDHSVGICYCAVRSMLLNTASLFAALKGHADEFGGLSK